MTQKILEEVSDTAFEIEQQISSVNQEQINTIPFENSWTVAQLADHLLKSESLILKTLHGAVKRTERQPDEKVEMIKQSFLDFNAKMTSPDFLVPTNTEQRKEELLNSLQDKREQLTEVVKTLNLSETCVSFSPPGMDELTRLEWIYFFIYHSQRHVHQLKNIVQKLQTNQNVAG